ncbi:thiamine pyrophosphate-binding protein [Streptomyces sp. NK08204]|uniref:thiamine pyrophosphate-binding protein n=1 Tax=Streptomyces sp. NK08204 TaxID=2873260 RepID=UPI001CEDB0E9|nr:thiamine pyrophosphate-binding protein [Streptomyces sp. NK08204]
MANVSRFLAARLRTWGVDRVFGMPGRDVDALVGVLRGTPDHPEFVQARHEESAALMACAHAKLTGRPGCCLAPSGAGALRLTSGLYDAALDRQPVVAVVGEEEPAHSADGRRRTPHATPLLAEVSRFAEPVNDPRRAGDALDRAFQAALTERGPAALVVPRSVLTAEAPKELKTHDAAGTVPARFEPPARPPRMDDVRRAAGVLNDGRKVAIVVGRGAARAADRAAGVAGLLGAGIATTPLARDVLPDDLPYVAGVAAPYGSTAAAALLRDCDTLLLLGAGDLDRSLLPDDGRRRVVALDAEAAAPGSRPAAGLHVTGDVAAALDALLPLLRRKHGRAWRETVERAVDEWRVEGRAKAHRFFGTSVNPRAVVAELSARLPDRAVVVTDSGSALDWWTTHLELRAGMRALLSDGLAAPGAAVPYAVAARLACPDRPVIALVGDGAFQARGLNELLTVRRHLERFAKQPPLLFCVLNNGDLNRLTWQRRTESGDPRIPPSQEVPDAAYADYARLLGLAAVRCDRPRAVGDVWEWALSRMGPALLEFAVDGEVPPDWAEPEGRGGTADRSRPRVSHGRVRRLIGAAPAGLFRPG